MYPLMNFRRFLHFRHSKFPEFMRYLKKLETSTLRHESELFNATRFEIHELRNGLDDLQELKKLFESKNSDEEIKKMAMDDIRILEPKLENLSQTISDSLIHFNQKYDDDDAVVEVIPGAGGLEAGLFAEEIFNLYFAYTENDLGYDVELREYERLSGTINNTGISRASLIVKGLDVFKSLKYECGVHRVQRVPLTGTKNDRLQTSTCSVAVVPLPKNFSNIEISDKDLKCDYCRSSGPGGQGVNTTDSAVRMVHLPTKIVVECQVHRTAHANRALALEKLKSKLYQMNFEKDSNQIASTRKSQIGNMNRNEKIRTYNYPRNSITDHRIGSVKQVSNMSDYMKGSLGFSVLNEFRTALKSLDDEENIIRIITDANS